MLKNCNTLAAKIEDDMPKMMDDMMMDDMMMDKEPMMMEKDMMPIHPATITPFVHHHHSPYHHPTPAPYHHPVQSYHHPQPIYNVRYKKQQMFKNHILFKVP